jgi:hypothetical protein
VDAEAAGLSTKKRESEGSDGMAAAPEWASRVCCSKNSSTSSVLMLERHAFFPFREPFDAFPIVAAAAVVRSRWWEAARGFGDEAGRARERMGGDGKCFPGWVRVCAV